MDKIKAIWRHLFSPKYKTIWTEETINEDFTRLHSDPD